MPPLINDRSYSVEELNKLTYRKLQQAAKSLSLPANVKKEVLIELIHAKTTKSQAELDSIVQRVKNERLLNTQARGKGKRVQLQGNEVSSTTTDSLEIKEKDPNRPKSPESKELNCVTYEVKQPVSAQKTSDRVLRSNSASYKRPNYSMINDPEFELDKKLAVKKEPNNNGGNTRKVSRIKSPVQAIIERTVHGNTERLSLLKKPVGAKTKPLAVAVSSSTQTNTIPAHRNNVQHYTMEMVPVYTKPKQYTSTHTKQEPESKNFVVDNYESNSSILTQTQRNNQVVLNTPVKQEKSKFGARRTTNNGKISIKDETKKTAQRITDDTGEMNVIVKDIIDIKIESNTLFKYKMNFKRDEQKNKVYQRRLGNQRNGTANQRKVSGNQRKETGYQRKGKGNQKKETSYKKEVTTFQRQDTGYESENISTQIQYNTYQDMQNQNYYTKNTSYQTDDIKMNTYQIDTNYQSQGTDYKSKGTGYKSQGTDYKLQGTDYKLQGTDYKSQGTDYKLQGTNYKLDTGIQWQDTYYQDMKRYYPNMSSLSDVMEKQRTLYRKNNAKVRLNKILAKKVYKQANWTPYQYLPNPYNATVVQANGYGKLNKPTDVTQPLYVEVEDINTFGGATVDHIVFDPTPALLPCREANNNMQTLPDSGAFNDLTYTNDTQPSALNELTYTNDTQPLDVQVNDSGIIVEVPPMTPYNTSTELRDNNSTYSTSQPNHTDQIGADKCDICGVDQKPLPKIHEAFSKFTKVKYDNNALYEHDTDHHFDNNGEVSTPGFEDINSYSYPPLEQLCTPKMTPMTPTTCTYDVPFTSTPRIHRHGTTDNLRPTITVKPNRSPFKQRFEQDKENHSKCTMDEVSEDLVPYTEQEMTLRKYHQVLSKSNSAQSECSQEERSGVAEGAAEWVSSLSPTKRRMLDEVLAQLAREQEYMESVNSDDGVKCVLCSWIGAQKTLLHDHIKENHSSDITLQSRPEWAVRFALTRGWGSHVSEYGGRLYVVSALGQGAACMAALTTPAGYGEPKMGTIAVYNQVTDEPYYWHGQIQELSNNMPLNCLTVDLAKLGLLPNTTISKLDNKTLSNTPSEVMGETDLSDIHINVYVQIHD